MAETSDDETSDFDRGMFVPPTNEDDVDTEDDMAVEDNEVVGGYKIIEEDELAEDGDDVPSPPPKRFKSQRTGKAAAATTKVTVGRKEKQVEVDAEMMPVPPSRKTKLRQNPKSKKGMLRAVIDMTAKKIQEDRDAEAMGGGLEREAEVVSFDSILCFNDSGYELRSGVTTFKSEQQRNVSPSPHV